MEIATLTRKDNKTVMRILPESEVNVHIKKHEEEEARLEAEKKKEADRKKAGRFYLVLIIAFISIVSHTTTISVSKD